MAFRSKIFIDIYSYVWTVTEEIKKKIKLGSTWPGVIKIMMEAYRSLIEWKVISKLYKILEDLNADNTLYVKERWEREANIVVSGEDWGK